jgi:hypothetical protein
MHAWIRRALCAAGLTGGLLLLGFGLAEAASADDSGPVTTGESGILSGNQTDADARAPINLSGNQVTVIGQDNKVTSTGGSSTAGGAGGSGSPTTSGEDGIGAGNQTDVDVLAPVNASGNQVTVIGQDNQAQSASGSAAPSSGTGSDLGTTTGKGGLLAGNQTALGLTPPINVSGNQVTVIGQDNESTALGGSTTGATTGGGGAGGSAAAPTTSGEDGIGSGNQTGIAVLAPIAATGNQVTVIGQDNTVSSTGGATTGSAGTGSGGATTSGENGLLAGNQTGVAVTAPVNASGNQATVIGEDNGLTSTGGTTTPGGSSGPGQTTTGEGGIGSGNQTPVSVQVPVDVSGNQVTVVGEGNTTTSSGGSSTGGTSPGGGTTSPPGGGVVSPPGSGETPQGGPTPAAGVLPSTGMSDGLLGAALLGLLLLLLGAALSGRGGRQRCAS